MSDKGLRASDADREATVSRLHTASLEGRLTPEELEQRVTDAYAARHCAELDALTADLTPAPAPPPAAPVFVQPRVRTNGFAIASLVCGLLWFFWLGSAAAIATGHLALRQIARSGGAQTGRSIAIAGLCLGYLGAVTLTFMLIAVALL